MRRSSGLDLTDHELTEEHEAGILASLAELDAGAGITLADAIETIKRGPREVLAMEIFSGISMDPGIRFGKPCITGTRIDVATVVGALAAGESIEAVQDAYAITREQILAAAGYARGEVL